jgi:DNA-binding Lrp family transcriptional regulator
MDSVDRRLLALLKHDGRASVTTLAGKLGVSRATVQARMDRLKQSGSIQRFTIDIAHGQAGDVIRAVMLVEVQGNLTRSVIHALRRLPEISDLHSTNGAWDLVGQIETSSLAEFDRTLRDVREIKGILNSETCLLLNSAQA